MEKLVAEAITPLGDFDTAAMASGRAGAPASFRWRDRVVRVATVLETWTDNAPCRHGSGESYRNRHWFRVRTDTGVGMVLYVERRRRAGSARQWRLYTLDEGCA